MKKLLIQIISILLFMNLSYSSSKNYLTAEYWKGNLTVDLVKQLIFSGIDINASNNKGETVLMLSARYNKNPDILNELIYNGADVNSRTLKSVTVLMYVSRYDTLNVLDSIFRYSSQKVIELLVKNGADINARDNNGKTALMYACLYNNDPLVIEQLVNSGADINAIDNSGKTALDYLTDNSSLRNSKVYGFLRRSR